MLQTQLIYASAATETFNSGELRVLLQLARENNSQLGITGLLLYHNRSFFQVLEGEPEAVNSLYAHISRDKRHNRVLLLSKREIENRNFAEWSMGFLDLSNTENELPGFIKLLNAKSSFLDLKGESRLVANLIDGFQDGRWRQSVSNN